jgi:hypothetical protein
MNSTNSYVLWQRALEYKAVNPKIDLSTLQQLRETAIFLKMAPLMFDGD